MKNIFWRLQAFLFYILTLVASLVPEPIAYRYGSLAGLLIPYIVPKRQAISIDNISQSLLFMKSHLLWNSLCNDPRTLAHEIFRNLGRSLMEISRLYQGRGENIISNIEVRGWENYETAKAKGKGIIFFSGHCGNWELMSLALSNLFGETVSGVARQQNNPFFNKMVEKMRSRYNSKLIYKHGALKGILSALKKCEMVGILADQAVRPEEGCLIKFIGRTAWASRMPAVIARKTGAPLIPVFIHRDREHHVLTFYPEHVFTGTADDDGINEDTQDLSRYIENYVVAHPTQWYWIHRRWKRAGICI